jgi:hypothetical protein
MIDKYGRREITSWRDLPDEALPALEALDVIIDEENGTVSFDLDMFGGLIRGAFETEYESGRDMAPYVVIVNMIVLAFTKACEEQLINENTGITECSWNQFIEKIKKARS